MAVLTPQLDILPFAIAMAAGQLTPGPDMLLILKNTLNHGLPSGLATISGICTGIIVHVTVALTGLSVLLAGHPALYRALQLAGACYLLWVAWKLLAHLRFRTALPFAPQPPSPTPSPVQAYREGLVTNLTNVKVLVLFSSILAPVAASPEGLRWLYGVVIIVEAALIWPLFAWLMQRPAPRHLFFRYQRGLNLLFALLITAFALHLLLAP